MSDLEVCSDDPGPTSHHYLYEIDREQLFSMFVGAVASLRVDSDGVHCLSAEAQALSRMARAVQGRTVDDTTPREEELGSLATVLRVLLSTTDARDRGDEAPEWHMSLDELVAYFLWLRAKVGDFIPAASPIGVPDDLSVLDEVLDDEVSVGDDIVTEEGGYRWHTDGRPPEPLHD